MSAAHSLRRRITAAFSVTALCTALLFSGFAVILMYALEDEFFGILLDEEVAHQQASLDATQALTKPLRPYVSLHRDATTVPADLQRHPGVAGGGEFFGDAGRHYHVRRLNLRGEAQPVLMVAEVGGELVVRPRIPATLGLLGACLVLLLVLITGLGYWLARRATRPLDQLAVLVASVAPEQLPKGFAANYPRNEIGALARALDDAMARVASFIEREQQFTRDASHELRTPLAVIEGAAYLIAEQPLPPQAAQQVQRIRSAATDMAQTVDTLLALAREELPQASVPGQAAPAEVQPVPLLALAESTVVRLAHLLDGKAVEVEVAIDSQAQFRMPRPALAIVLANVVGNAFQHTQSGRVRISYDGGKLSVSDDGPGVDAAIRSRIFEAGVKGCGSSGHGLGLSIARRLANRIGLELQLAPGANGGTVVTLAPRQ